MQLNISNWPIKRVSMATFFYKLLEMSVGSEVNGQLIHVGEAEETDLSLEHSQTDPNLNLEQQS